MEEEKPKLPSKEIQDKLDSLSWEWNRIQGYNSLNQYEMIYDDIKAGNLGKTGKWYKAVTKIKEDHPKPEDIPALEKEIKEALENAS